MKKNKAFILFSPAFPGNEEDTIWLPSLQTFIRAINRNFPELEVKVFAFQYPHTTEVYKWYGNTIIPFNGWYKKRPARLFMWMKIFFRVRQIRKEYNVVGVFSQWCGECTFVAKWISNFFRIKQFCWILGQDARTSNTYVKYIRPKASSLITLSDFLADEFYRNHGIKPMYTVPKGIDVALFHPSPPKKDIDVIGVGSLSILKRYDVFVQVIAELKKSLPNIKAMLCGDGEDRAHIEKMIHDLSLTENIKLTGSIPHAEALKMMQRAKILLHPSSYEGFGTVCLEGLYAGAYVISFVQPMYREIKNWYIIKTTEEMQLKALEILTSSQTIYEPVLAYSADDAAKNIMRLFGFSK
jgi:glycosyltransferase involved in cell wall biosynthesis